MVSISTTVFRFTAFLVGISFLFKFCFALVVFKDISFPVMKALVFGLWFDFALVGFFIIWALVAIIFQFLLKWGPQIIENFLKFLISIELFLLLIDLRYFLESGRHIQYEVNEVGKSLNEVFQIAVDSWGMWLILFLLILILRKIKVVAIQQTSKKRFFGETFAVFLTALLLARGGWVNIPIDPGQSHRMGDSKLAAISLNGAYSMIYGFLQKEKVDQINVVFPAGFNQQKYLSEVFSKVGGLLQSPTTKANFIIVFLEGWSAIYQNSGGNSENVTPYFEELRAKSLRSDIFLAGGHRTTEGVFSVFCSFQNPLGRSIAQSHLANFSYDCLPSILKENGWRTSFFQGSARETSGTGSFAQSLGIEFSFGKENLRFKPKYEFNKWGLHDPDIYKEVLEYFFENQNQPQLLAINTNSTHDLVLPSGVKSFSPGSDPESKYKSVLHFADSALKDFVSEVNKRLNQQNSKWPTYLVLVADHTSYNQGNAFEQYKIPFLLSRLDKPIQPRNLNVGCHRDIAPTLLGLVGGFAPQFTGNDLNQVTASRGCDYFHLGTLGWIENEKLIEVSLKNPEGLKCFNNLAGKIIPKVCGAEDLEIRNRGLAFTSMSQKNLFSGKTKSWFQTVFDAQAEQ